MSQHPSASGPPSSDPTQEQNRGVGEGAEYSVGQHTAGTSRSQDAQESTSESLSWHRSSPVEPAPVPTQPRSIGVHAILNPPESTAFSAAPRRSSRDPLQVDLPASIPSSPRQRGSSSPLSRPSHPNTQLLQVDRPSLSPGIHPRRIITPVSPAARLASVGGRLKPFTGKISVSQSPFVQEPSTGLYSIAPGAPLSIETSNAPNVALQGRYPQSHPSIHSTPTFHNRRSSAGPATNPSSQDTSPSTPHSTYSQFGQSPPTASSGLLQPPGPPHLKPPPFPTMESLGRLPSAPGGPRYGGEDPSISSPHPELPGFPGMIPVVVDFKSGSRSQAEKRKANSDASRRFRNRKKNELVLEQRINSQTEEIRMLTEERDHYRAERDFYRETVSRTTGLGQLPARPLSPRHFRPSLNQPAAEAGSEPAWRGSEGSTDNAGGRPGRIGQLVSPRFPNAPHLAPLPPVAQGGWSVDRSSYPAPTPDLGQSGAQDDRQERQQPPYSGAWTGGPPTENLGGRQRLQTEPIAAPPSPYQDPHHRQETFDRSWNPRP